ncbi:MAG: site-2 protease family protein [Deltaproteobacteria bacterium]|nr:site-2 protease family protein [Deltaproteobacteria bacterium]
MSIAVSALLVAVLILLHETGHYLVARMCRMRVNRFSIGFGPAIARFRPRWSETTFQIAAIPLGGFVQIAGMDPNEPVLPGDTGSYASRPLWQRAAVIMAGPVANWVVAAAAFSLLYGIGFPKAEGGTRIGEVTEDGPAQKAGLRPGDRILAIDGARVTRWVQVAGRTRESAGRRLVLRVRRDSEVLEIRVKPRRDRRTGQGLIGIAPAVRLERRPGLGAIAAGARQAASDCAVLVLELARAVTGKGVEGLMGPVGIIAMAKEQAERGLRAFVHLAGGLSVALAVMNFLPLPALDGGRLIFLGYEVVTRRRVPPRFEAVVHWVGLLLLLALLVLVTFRDILVASS